MHEQQNGAYFLCVDKLEEDETCLMRLAYRIKTYGVR